MSGRDWSKELIKASLSVDMVRGYFLILAGLLAIMVIGFITMFFVIKLFGVFFGLAVGALIAAGVGTFVYDYYARLKREFGKFGIGLQLFFAGPLGIGMWIPNKMVTEESGMQITKMTGIESVPHLALDWVKPIEKEPTQMDLVFWRGFPITVQETYLTAKYVGEYESKQFGRMPEFKVLFASSMLEQ